MTREDTARHEKTRQGTRRHEKARQGTRRHGKAREGTARHEKAREGTARHEKARARGTRAQNISYSIETVYLDPCGEFLTQVLIHYMGQPKWWILTTWVRFIIWVRTYPFYVCRKISHNDPQLIVEQLLQSVWIKGVAWQFWSSLISSTCGVVNFICYSGVRSLATE